MLFKKGSADAGAKSPASKTGGGEKTSSIPLPAAIGLLAVALVLLFFTVLRPMLFSEAPPPSSPAPEAGVEGLPGAPGVPPPPVSPGGNVGGPGAADSAAGQPAPAPPPPAPAAPATGPAAPAAGGGASAPAPAAPGDVSLTPETGEILVKGTVTQVDAPKLKLRMSVTSVQLGGQPERALCAPCQGGGAGGQHGHREGRPAGEADRHQARCGGVGHRPEPGRRSAAGGEGRGRAVAAIAAESSPGADAPRRRSGPPRFFQGCCGEAGIRFRYCEA